MQYKFVRFCLIGVGLIFLAGCATQPNIRLSEDFWQNHEKVVVATTKAPKPEVYHSGNQALLEYAISNIATSSAFSNYVEKSELAWYERFSQKFVAQLKQHHMNAEVYPDLIDPDQKSYTNVITHLDTDRLLVIKLDTIGSIREYNSVIPLGPPQAYCVMTGELLTARGSQILWRYQATVKQPVQGEWDQPPNYPNFRKALESAVDSAQQEVLDSFFSGH